MPTIDGGGIVAKSYIRLQKQSSKRGSLFSALQNMDPAPPPELR